MTRRLTYEFVKNQFASEGYELLSKEYINNHTKLKYMCPNGHKHSIRWNDWLRGRRCYFCYGNVKLDIDFVRKEFESRGYKLLSTVYVNNSTKLDFICSCGKKHSMSYSSFYMGHKCPICARKELSLRYCGEGNPAWNNGSSYEPYCSVWIDKDYKDSIKERDNYVCQNPECWGTSERLVIHHIDYVKKHCDPCNLITLCNSCNARANVNRGYWKELYTNLMIKKAVSNV